MFVVELSGELVDESDDDGCDRCVVYVDDVDLVVFDVYIYEEVTLKYINLSYYEKCVVL